MTKRDDVAAVPQGPDQGLARQLLRRGCCAERDDGGKGGKCEPDHAEQPVRFPGADRATHFGCSLKVP